MTRTAFASDDFRRLFEDARLADIAAVAGVRLWRGGRRLRGECPLCGASREKKADGAFSADPNLRVWKCFACDEGGDVIDLERQLRGGTPREAAERLVGPAAPRPLRAADPPKAERPAPAVSMLAARLWRNARPAGFTVVETYLRGRGIDGWVLAAALRRLRFHPDAFWGFSEDGRQALSAPAMIASVAAPDAPTGGCHATYLTDDGRKSHLRPAKRMFGPQLGGEDRPGGVWLLNQTDGPLIVGEGIESTLSAAMLYGEECSAVATLSLNRLQGGWLRDAWGRVDADTPRPDPSQPAFVWPQLRRRPVRIAVDRDMSPIKVKVRKALGGTAERVINADERARICAGLAIAAWKRAGFVDVAAIDPGPGRDFNDLLVRGAC